MSARGSSWSTRHESGSYHSRTSVARRECWCVALFSSRRNASRDALFRACTHITHIFHDCLDILIGAGAPRGRSEPPYILADSAQHCGLRGGVAGVWTSWRCAGWALTRLRMVAGDGIRVWRHGHGNSRKGARSSGSGGGGVHATVLVVVVEWYCGHCALRRFHIVLQRP